MNNNWKHKLDDIGRTGEYDHECTKRIARVLSAYSRDIRKYGKPLDSGLPSLLEFVADELEAEQDDKKLIKKKLEEEFSKNPDNRIKEMPDEIKIYNASSEPCDMLVGPCCCGAWHSKEDWISRGFMD